MRISYDAEVDALYLEFHKLAPGTAEARTLAEAIIADFGPDGTLAGLEILDARTVLGHDGGHAVGGTTPTIDRQATRA